METEIYSLNSIPTFENVQQVYQNLDLPDLDGNMVQHKKELMIVMIINLLRVKPKIFLYQMENLRSKIENRGGSKPRTMMFYSSDVESCINLLTLSEPVQALELSDSLC